MRAKWLLVCVLLLVGGGRALATDYYVSPSGNDNNSGTSPEQAWKTITKVNSRNLDPGDRVMFEGGQTFVGTLELDRRDKGVAGNYILVGSYGTGRALINGGLGDGITMSNSEYVEVSNIIVVGDGRLINNGGKGINLASCAYVTIDGVDASGFQKAGVDITGSNDCSITNAYVYDNGFAGIHVHGGASGNNTNIYIGNCRVISNDGDPDITNNHSGSGILIAQTSYAVVEYCEAAYNGCCMPWTGNGPVGIWAWDADHITFQYCISHNNLSPGHDGGGFDFDGGTNDSLMQYCYSYDNAGWGYLVMDFSWQNLTTTNCIVRYCISENDEDSGISIGNWGTLLDSIDFHNNVIYHDNGSNLIRQMTASMSNMNFRNNIFVSGGTLNMNKGLLNFQGNCYYSLSGSYNFDGYSTVDAWANATGAEKLNGIVVGLQGDPGLVAPGNGEPITSPRQLASVNAYKLSDGSAIVIDKGLDLLAEFGFDPGSNDFYGTPIPVGAQFDVGAHEYRNIADFDYDHNITFTDYAKLASAWKRSAGQAGYDDIYDLHDNDTIDTNDVRIFTDEWLWSR